MKINISYLLIVYTQLQEKHDDEMNGKKEPHTFLWLFVVTQTSTTSTNSDLLLTTSQNFPFISRICFKEI
jgi:hypothetical protein